MPTRKNKRPNPPIYEDWLFNKAYHDEVQKIIQNNIHVDSASVAARQKAEAYAQNFNIPFIKDKRIKLTNAGKLTGSVLSTNMLDSIAKYAAITGVPIDTAIGLAGQESTFGNLRQNIGAKNVEEGIHNINPIDLYSDWNYMINPYQDLIGASTRKAYLNTRPSFEDYPIEYYRLYDKYIKEGINYANRQYSNTKLIPPLQHALELYKTGNYNIGDKNHTRDVNNSAKAAWNSPEIKYWWENEGKNFYNANKMKYGGRRKAQIGTEKKDNTNVAPIYREPVFIPATGATLMKQKARPKINGRPVASGAIEIVSPEFDLLTGIRGIANLPKGFLKTKGLPKGEELYYRQVARENNPLERAKNIGIIDVKSAPKKDVVTRSGLVFNFGKTFDVPFFSKGNLWYGYNTKYDVIVGKDNPLLDWKMITQHGRVTKNATKAATRRTPFYDGEVNQAPTELFELYRHYPGIGYRNVTHGFPAMPITGLNTVGEQMKCGGRRKAQLGLDIREGGIAIPIANNMYYMNGRSHEYGGIAIGPNNKNGLEVEGGEVVEMIDANHPSVGRQFSAGGQKQTIRVFSSVPFLRGVSPAQLVMGGANPDKVFKAQEEFKDRNRINDDGTTYKMGGDNKYYSTMEKVAKDNYKQWGFNNEDEALMHALNDNTYNYRGYYNKYPNSTANADTHWTDEFKTAYHPTFSIESIYSGNKSIYNPLGLKGGYWDGDIFVPAKWQKNKKEFGGMVYTINGNVKNGLGSLRPKAKYGTIDRKDKDVKVGPDGLIYRRDARGNWWTDGTKHVTAKPITKNSRNDLYYANPIEGLYHKTDSNNNFSAVSSKVPKEYTKITRDFGKPKRTYLSTIDDEEKETKKIGSLIYEKDSNGKWVPSKNQSSTTTRDGGRPKDFGITRTGINHPNGTYKYHPLTGERIEEIVEEPKETKSSKTSTPRKGGSRAATSTKAATKSSVKPATESTKTVETPAVVRREEYYNSPISTDDTPVKVDESYAARMSRGTQAVAESTPSSTGGGQQSSASETDERWIGQYKPVQISDWIGLGANVLGSIGSYFITQKALKNMPEPAKPVMTPTIKLKTRYNIEPQLTESREGELVDRAAVARNTASSNTSLARQQRISNAARQERAGYYGQKENIETRLINQDRLNRQQQMAKNVATYNDYLNRVYASKRDIATQRASSINNLITGLTGSVNSMLSGIETRRMNNNTLRAIAAANPNVDARLIGGFDYYDVFGSNRRYDRHGNLIRG